MSKTMNPYFKPRIRERKPRRRLGATVYRNYSNEMLQLACDAVASKQITSRDAERQFGIPRRTIVNKVKQLHMKPMGRPTCLTDIEESKIVKALIASSDFGSPLSKLDLQLIVQDYLTKNCKESVFNGKLPGKDWVQNFLRRHANELSLRVTQNISRGRATKGAEEIAEYFNHLYQTLKNVPPENIVNLDETNLADDPGSTKCIFRRGVRYPERVINSTKGNISLMFTATASGECLPIYVVYKADNMYSEWITGGPPETRYNRTKSGWFERSVFEEYFVTIILPWAQATPGTKVVICDNLSSHLSIKILELCESNNIKFVFIPPRSTHLTQPLDVAFFAPLKRVWRKILYRYKAQNPKQTTMNKKHFPKLLTELTQAIDLRQATNIKSGFRASGIVPLNPQQVLKRIPDYQEEIMSYGIDEAFLNYLKETRSEKPMQVKRCKKINCEPGKSVTIDDINTPSLKQKTSKTLTKGKTKKQKPVVQNQNEVDQDCYDDDFVDDQTGQNVDLNENIIDADSDEINDKLLSNEIERMDGRVVYLDEETGMYIDTNAIDYDVHTLWMEDENYIGKTCQSQDQVNESFNYDSDATVTLEYLETKDTKDDILKRKIKKENHKIIKQFDGPSTSKGLTSNSSKPFFRPFTYFDSDSDTDTKELSSLNIQTVQTKPRQVTKTNCQETGKSQNSTIDSLADTCMHKIEPLFSNDKHREETGILQNSSVQSLVAICILKIKALLSNGQLTDQDSYVMKMKTSIALKTIIKPSQSKKQSKSTSKQSLSPKPAISPAPLTSKYVPNQSNKITILKETILNKQTKLSCAVDSSISSQNKKKPKKKNTLNINNDAINWDSDTNISCKDYTKKIISENEDAGTNEEDANKENRDFTSDNTVTVGNYVLVGFKTKMSKKYYTGLVVEKSDSTSFTVKFMRKKNNSSTFVWPKVDDMSFVLSEDIEAVLPKPNIGRRGKLTFNFNFSKINVY